VIPAPEFGGWFAHDAPGLSLRQRRGSLAVPVADGPPGSMSEADMPRFRIADGGRRVETDFPE
jgi:hypothetical protein